MKNMLIPVVLFLSFSAQCQFYYKDLVEGKTLNDRMKSFRANKVRTVTATGFDERGARTNDFGEVQDIDLAQRLLRITTRNGQQVTRQYFRFDEQDRLQSIADSTDGVQTMITYQYDAQNRLLRLTSSLNDTQGQYAETEEHQWNYDAAGKPRNMWRIVNGSDSSEYRFDADEQGNIISEKLFRRNYGFDSLYYYYDDENRLTDIVRYDKRVKRLLPDFMFEYDEKNRVIQKITTVSTTNRDYLIWRYLFNEKGLKTKEALFNKNKELTGRIEYAYQFNP